jgi:hypothetical protein
MKMYKLLDYNDLNKRHKKVIKKLTNIFFQSIALLKKAATFAPQLRKTTAQNLKSEFFGK